MVDYYYLLIPIGSVKTNIGHLESSAGTAGLIKVLLMMKHKTIVPSLHYSEENGNKGIDFNKIPLVVSTKLIEWHPHVDGTRISCVNCFGEVYERSSMLYVSVFNFFKK
jgi:acyl transferase domain-containing protein